MIGSVDEGRAGRLFPKRRAARLRLRLLVDGILQVNAVVVSQRNICDVRGLVRSGGLKTEVVGFRLFARRVRGEFYHKSGVIAVANAAVFGEFQFDASRHDAPRIVPLHRRRGLWEVKVLVTLLHGRRRWSGRRAQAERS